jgi:antitoxin (DNA-binding transcriptional repressor) of toxin-antitoxin stability system
MKSKIQTINTKELRTQMKKVIERVRKGGSFLVLHRSRPAFQINPPEFEDVPQVPLKEDPIYHAAAVGRNRDGLRASDHDRVLYSK